MIKLNILLVYMYAIVTVSMNTTDGTMSGKFSFFSLSFIISNYNFICLNNIRICRGAPVIKCDNWRRGCF